jgi:hypothetical protein
MVPIDIAIRLADEGVPVQAIARATGLAYADLHAQLQMARMNGDLVAIPRADWPTGYPREQKLQLLTRLVLHNKTDVERTICRIFGLRPHGLGRILLLLLLRSEVHRERIHRKDSSTGAVYVSHLRRALQPFGLAVETHYARGYSMRPEHRRLALDLIFDAARANNR